MHVLKCHGTNTFCPVMAHPDSYFMLQFWNIMSLTLCDVRAYLHFHSTYSFCPVMTHTDNHLMLLFRNRMSSTQCGLRAHLRFETFLTMLKFLLDCALGAWKLSVFWAILTAEGTEMGVHTTTAECRYRVQPDSWDCAGPRCSRMAAHPSSPS